MTDKKTPSRIYIVTDKRDATVTNVRATNPSQAINYATRDRFSIRVATVDDFIAKESVLDATVAGVHPDQQPLDLDDKGGTFGGAAA
jgi:hypothetical protein